MSANDPSAEVDRRSTSRAGSNDRTPIDRRGFLSSASSLVMAGGLAASYGTFVVMAGRFLYPSTKATTWTYVTPVSRLKPGSTMTFVLPSGLKTVINRRAESRDDSVADADDFLALSSTCPHLGCQVHWEPQNARFYCPCHGGAFDADGAPIAGPPKDDNEPLPQYPLTISNGILYMEIPSESVGGSERRLVAVSNGPPVARRRATASERKA